MAQNLKIELLLQFFLARIFIFSRIIVLPKGQKILRPDFLFWAPFGDKGPKRANRSSAQMISDRLRITIFYFYVLVSLIVRVGMVKTTEDNVE